MLAANWKLKAASSVAFWSAMAFATVGASLVLATVRWKVSSTDAAVAVVAVTLTEIVPTSPFAGVPEKVRVAALKVSQAGSARHRQAWRCRSACRRLYVGEGVGGNRKLKAVSSVRSGRRWGWPPSGRRWCWPRDVERVIHRAAVAVVGGHPEEMVPDIGVDRRPGEGPGRRVEVSQAGSAAPPARSRCRSSVSPASTSAKVLAGTGS